MPFYRYARWDGTQQVFPIQEEDLMAHLSEQLVTQGDISNALRSMAQNGLHSRFSQKVPGIQDMLQGLRSMRQRALDQYNLEHILDNISQGTGSYNVWRRWRAGTRGSWTASPSSRSTPSNS